MWEDATHDDEVGGKVNSDPSTDELDDDLVIDDADFDDDMDVEPNNDDLE